MQSDLVFEDLKQEPPINSPKDCIPGQTNCLRLSSWTLRPSLICLRGVSTMRRTILIARSLLIVVMLMTLMAVTRPSKSSLMAQQDMWLQWTPSSPWKPNDRHRPLPPVITPGTCSTQTSAGAPPSDAMLLFNGKDLSNCESINGGPAKSTVGNGYFVVRTAQGIFDPRFVWRLPIARRMGDSESAPWKDRKSTRLNSSHSGESRMPSSA